MLWPTRNLKLPNSAQSGTFSQLVSSSQDYLSQVQGSNNTSGYGRLFFLAARLPDSFRLLWLTSSQGRWKHIQMGMAELLSWLPQPPWKGSKKGDQPLFRAAPVSSNHGIDSLRLPCPGPPNRASQGRTGVVWVVACCTVVCHRRSSQPQRGRSSLLAFGATLPGDSSVYCSIKH